MIEETKFKSESIFKEFKKRDTRITFGCYHSALTSTQSTLSRFSRQTLKVYLSSFQRLFSLGVFQGFFHFFPGRF